MDDRKSESVHVNESSMEESESEIIHKSINTKKLKYSIYDIEDEEPLVTYNPVINEPSFLNLF